MYATTKCSWTVLFCSNSITWWNGPSEISGSHGVEHEEDCLLECWAVYYHINLPTFHRDLLPPSSRPLTALMMEVLSTSETSVYFYATTRCNIPEDIYLPMDDLFHSSTTNEMYLFSAESGTNNEQRKTDMVWSKLPDRTLQLFMLATETRSSIRVEGKRNAQIVTLQHIYAALRKNSVHFLTFHGLLRCRRNWNYECFKNFLRRAHYLHTTPQDSPSRHLCIYRLICQFTIQPTFISCSFHLP